MRIINCNGIEEFESPAPHGNFRLKTNTIYYVTSEFNGISFCNPYDTLDKWRCSYKDFRRYLRQGLIKIVLEK